MKFQAPVRELVRARESTRTFTGGPIDPGTTRKLDGECMLVKSGPRGEMARFRLVEKPFKKDQPVEPGDFGLQPNPRYLFTGAINKRRITRTGCTTSTSASPCATSN